MANALRLGDKLMAENFVVLAMIFINIDYRLYTGYWFGERSSNNLEYISFLMAYYYINYDD